MVVSIDKATAVRMYDKVQKHWKGYLDRLRTELASAAEGELEGIEDKIRYMEETDMAVVVSQSQNEITELRRKGADIVPHRKRMVKEDLDTKFKDPKDPFRIVFVCAMWMTGFDVPCCTSIYLDKPMRNHTLMQTIARANRVFGEKVNGLIVDYVGIFRDLQRALAIYGSGSGGGVEAGDTPVKDKSALVDELKNAIEEANDFCAERGIDLEAIESSADFERVRLLGLAVDALLVSDDSKNRYLLLAANVRRLFRAILPDPMANQLAPRCALFRVIALTIGSLGPEVDISEFMEEVDDLLDNSIAAQGYVIRETPAEYDTEHVVDLSQIDFDALKSKFERQRKHVEAEKLRGTLNAKLRRMVQLNRTRMNYLEQLQTMIDEYNSGRISVDELFSRLVALAQTLNEEEQRAVTEKLSEEELAVFDLLTKPQVRLSSKEREQVKAVARDLLEALRREKLVLDWRKRQQSRAGVLLSIEEALDTLPQAYTQDLYVQKCDAVYHHVYESYYGEGRSVYSVAA
jgi:type I restriction enzyme R subunit